MFRKLAYIVAVALFTSCQGYVLPEIKEPLKLAGGKTISVDTLKAGREAYTHYCRACHGDKGDGNGPAAKGLRPPPRNFTRGVFKFAGVPAGTLPHDEDFVRIVRGGLHGTAMVPWDVPDQTLNDIIQYLKSFSPKWKEEEPGEIIAAASDKNPWAGKTEEAVQLGKKLYHGYAQCAGCHPAYGSKQELYEISKAFNPESPMTTFRDDMYGPSATESLDYSVDNDRPLKILPPDFTRHQLRSVRPGKELEDLYRVIAAGVGGTAMPSWKASGLEEDKLWALAYYVKSLSEMKGTVAAADLFKKIEVADQTWKAPEAAAPAK